MKNQYVGDVNDYRKYGLIRAIHSASGFRILVAWMLTRDDGRTDGQTTGYLDQPDRWEDSTPSCSTPSARPCGRIPGVTLG